MKLSLIESESPARDAAYTTVNSIHQVRNIFRNGFKEMVGARRICFVQNEKDAISWAGDLSNIYIIKTLFPKDEFDYKDRMECGVQPRYLTPVGWGIITGVNLDNKLNRNHEGAKIHWQHIDPNDFEISDLANFTPLNKWALNDIERDTKLSEEDAIIDALLSRGWSYGALDLYPDEKIEEIKKIVRSLANKKLTIPQAFKKSGLSLPEFNDALELLLYNEYNPKDDSIRWDDFAPSFDKK